MGLFRVSSGISTDSGFTWALWWDDEWGLYFFLISLVSAQTAAIILSDASESVQEMMSPSLILAPINLGIV